MEGFPKIEHFINNSCKQYLVMELLDINLLQIFHKIGNKMSLETVVMIAEEMIDRLKSVHDCGIIHRDIKPENMMVKFSNSNRIYLVDFGLQDSYLNRDGKHVEMKDMMGWNGTIRYMSSNAHMMN